MYQIRRTTQFKKDIKRVLKRGKELEQLQRQKTDSLRSGKERNHPGLVQTQ